ncbi:MAG: pirin family protein [Rhodospirillaceae bacterium]|jgi:quercetin 2,3-dioxygenase|nr:pirin family protein [Rhodospirillaceae bacterium]
MNVSLENSVQAATVREVSQLTPGMPASDGAGVQLTRIVGSPMVDMVDPFLLLDAFGSDKPGDYIAGFPDHPHRGFETVTYILAGRMRHKDNAGHEGVIGPGDVQWMTAGRGIVHSEMPEQEDGLLMGFQLWVNLPGKDKMTAPRYQEFPASEIAVEDLDGGGTVKVIAGRTDAGAEGPVKDISTDPLYLDVTLTPGAHFGQSVPAPHGGFIYVFEGSVSVGANGTEVPTGTLAVLDEGARVEVTASDTGGRFLLISGKRLNEPVARGGPFVMNTRAEVLQAFQDYQAGRF